MDNSSSENMKNLKKVGNDLLNKHVSRVNIETGLYEEVPEAGTNGEMLKIFAKKLSAERKRRSAYISANL